MTATLSSLWRYPIKAHGREEIVHAALSVGQCVPWDRTWAVAHTESTADGQQWEPCSNFTRAAKAPELQAITCLLDEASEIITLRHPKLDEIALHPERDAGRLIAWTASLVPQNRSSSARIVRAKHRGMTDSDLPSITLCNHASHRAVSQKAGQNLSIHRWRGNLWLDGLAPWEEFDWIGKDVKIGDAVLHVHEPTTRCLATHANPETGRRDIPVLEVLEHWGHRDFSVLATVIEPGIIKRGDRAKMV